MSAATRSRPTEYPIPVFVAAGEESGSGEAPRGYRGLYGVAGRGGGRIGILLVGIFVLLIATAGDR